MKFNLGDELKIKAIREKNNQLKSQILSVSTSELPLEIARIFKFLENMNEQVRELLELLKKANSNGISHMKSD